MRRLLAAAALLTIASGAAAETPRFALPIACVIGTDCFVQNYVDRDPGPGFADFTCGRLGYDGHKGTDIRLPTLAEMRDGVAVLAAAPGTVLRVRDGMADISTDATGREAVAGREAGNSLIIDHGDGWETQYAHLREGSVAVEPGEQVEAGQEIGLVGLSGDTEFPHLHFEVRHDGATVDPYLGLQPGSGAPQGCGVAGVPMMWSEEAARALAYRPTGLLAAGFADEAPSYDGILTGDYATDTAAPSAASPALVFWIYLFGIQAGDRLELELMAPDGSTVAESAQDLPKPKADYIAFAGRKKRGDAWPAGSYVGRFKLTRMVDGAAAVIAEAERKIELR
jgi:hypothetical protein